MVDASHDVLKIALKELVWAAVATNIDSAISKQIALANERLAAAFAVETAASLAQKAADDAMRQTLLAMTNDAMSSVRAAAVRQLENVLAIRTIARALGGIAEAYFFQDDIRNLIHTLRQVDPAFAQLENETRVQIRGSLAQSPLAQTIDSIIGKVADEIVDSHIESFRANFDALLAEVWRLIESVHIWRPDETTPLFPITRISLANRAFLDLDSGDLAAPPTADLQLLHVRNERYLIPATDVLVASGIADDFEALSLRTIRQLTFSSSAISLSTVPTGTVFAFRTNQRRYAKLVLEENGSPLRVKYVTFVGDTTILTR